VVLGHFGGSDGATILKPNRRIEPPHVGLHIRETGVQPKQEVRLFAVVSGWQAEAREYDAGMFASVDTAYLSPRSAKHVTSFCGSMAAFLG
jgi:hypothetical protein